MSNSSTTVEKYYIEVPYDPKLNEKLKLEGAKWCSVNKKWYVTDENSSLRELYKPIYLINDYESKDFYKANGAKYNSSKKLWYSYKSNIYLADHFIKE
jgi:hypothetical protein